MPHYMLEKFTHFNFFFMISEPYQENTMHPLKHYNFNLQISIFMRPQGCYFYSQINYNQLFIVGNTSINIDRESRFTWFHHPIIKDTKQ